MGCSTKHARRILIVDDSRAIHDDFRKVLNGLVENPELTAAEEAFLGDRTEKNVRLHYAIDHAFQGAEGVELVAKAVRENRPYDLVFVDMRMPPGLDGLETIERLWQNDKDLPAVICTAYSDHTWQNIVDRLGFNDKLLILKKPFDISEVSQLAAALTDKRHATREHDLHTNALEERVNFQTACVRLAHEETIIRLVSASMYRDKETGAHIKRVGLFSAELARATGWSDADVEMIRMAAPMHDVGKIGIPDAILLKTGPLNRDERQIMETHAEIGAQLLAGSESPMLQMASQIALYHHERWDGAGYPSGISGEEIPQVARIVAIADVYDAMTHDRVYRPAFSDDEVLATLNEGRGTAFDSELVDRFLEIAKEIEACSREYPDDTDAQQATAPRVELGSGSYEPAVPVSATENEVHGW